MPVPPFFPKHSVLSSLPALCTGLGLDLVCAWRFTVGHAPSAQAQPACGPITPGRAFQSVSASRWPSVRVEQDCRGRGVCFNFSRAQECCRRAVPSPCPPAARSRAWGSSHPQVPVAGSGFLSFASLQAEGGIYSLTCISQIMPLVSHLAYPCRIFVYPSLYIV